MSEPNKTSLRIDWFDGTLIEDNRSNSGASSSNFADEEPPEPPAPAKPQYTEKKPIGFKRLLEISLLQPPLLTLDVAHRAGFWHLLDTELKGDFIVLIVKVLANIYKSLEPGEKSRVSNLLRSKFQKSQFLDRLKDYLIDMPQVRVVEKRMNTQLWDDAESFYVNVVSLCEGIVDFGGNSGEFLNKIYELLETTEASVIGVREEHKETFSNDLFIRIQQLQSRILNLNNEYSEVTIQDTTRKLEETDIDPHSYKNLDIFPSRDDLLSNNKVHLQPNIINGAYPNVKHYLDLQFKLLREDCFGPLRDGISKYMENPSKRKYENIRVFPKVRILRTYVSNNKVGHLVDIAWKERINQTSIDSKKYAHRKQLMFGSLLLFTSDSFQTILCATVLDSSLSLLMDGYVAVTFQNPVSKKIFTEPYLMVESEVFFEPYHRVLKVLQSFKDDDLPMKRYIVDVQTETQPPAYLSSETIYSILDSEKSDEIPFPVLEPEQWPPLRAFGLDDSQMEAYKFALTREFAAIQGPPGTGKTFIGVKIASTLLRNLSLEGTPMLIICYTNHALDKFLEGILTVTKNVVRLGSQSKNKNLEDYTLHSLRGKVKSKYSYLYGSKRSELEKIYKEMTELQTEIEKCEKEIVSYKTLKPHLKIGDKLYELKSSTEDEVLSWLFNDTKEEFKTIDNNDLEDWEKQLDDVDNDKIDTCFSEEFALKEIDSMLNSIKYVKDVTDDHNESQKMTEKFKAQIDKVRKRLSCFKRYMSLGQDDKIELNVGKVSDLYSLTLDQRWQVYYSSVKCIKNDLMARMNLLLEQHNTCNRELNEVSTLIDGEVMRTVRVVGVTTTTAARRHDLMRRLLSPIVIIEEAAEVLEAHIVASLTHHCQHLILIGDHKQLRPSAAHYKLAKDYNLEISLFERMIRNNIHSRILGTQRRMRAQFASLLVPVIYDRLHTHPSADERPDVIGVDRNLYFTTHDVLEDSEGLEDSWSHKNIIEAKWCLALADYLRLMKYKDSEITILATYNGQATLIKEMSRKYESLQNVKITVVDNYQGEENRIIILSLVRSNREGKIGFLAAPNRICVALSRAKEGFYIFGNMNVLMSASNIWRFINDKLISQRAIGHTFPLRCHIHKDNVLEISTPEDFDAALSHTCLKICEKK